MIKGSKLTKEHKKKISEALKGRKFTDEWKQNLSKNNAKYWQGKYRVFTKEHKEKISKNHADVSGENNPFFGVCLYGKNNPAWRGGISNDPYCSGWEILTKEYKEYDNYKCQNLQYEKPSKRMTSHHIDYDKKNCHPDNIITLCNSCNVQANKDREWWQAYYIEIKRRRNFG